MYMSKMFDELHTAVQRTDEFKNILKRALIGDAILYARENNISITDEAITSLLETIDNTMESYYNSQEKHGV